MALLAASTEAAVVNIVALVTAVALRSQHRRKGLRVAGLAVHFLVAAVKCEFCVAVMIKLPRQPRSCHVARLALFAQRRLVNVVFFVTTHTGLWCI